MITGLLIMVQARLEVVPQQTIRDLSHSINNRMNAISLAMAILQQNILHHPNPEIRIIKHDIRNRLSALKLNLYMLERQGHPEQHDALVKMKEELGEINELLEDLNDID